MNVEAKSLIDCFSHVYRRKTDLQSTTLYVDIGCNNWGFPRKQFYEHLRKMIDAGFEKRILFGSDQMVWPGTIAKAIETVDKAPFLSRSQKRDIFYNNAARFLRLSKEEIVADHQAPKR